MAPDYVLWLEDGEALPVVFEPGVYGKGTIKECRGKSWAGRDYRMIAMMNDEIIKRVPSRHSQLVTEQIERELGVKMEDCKRYTKDMWAGVHNMFKDLGVPVLRSM